LRAMNSLAYRERVSSVIVASSANVAEMAHAERGPSTGVPAGTQATPHDPSAASNELHVQIEAPFVFHPTGPPPAPVEDVRALLSIRVREQELRRMLRHLPSQSKHETGGH